MKRDLQLDLGAATAQSPLAGAPQWRQALPLTVFVLLWIIAWHASTARSMVEIWQRSDTFAHGFIVPIISLWLIWRKRDELALISPRPSWLTLLAVAAAGFVWLAGELAAVNAASQLALTTLIVLAVVCVLGTAVARALAFPLAFLFFAVPIGEFVLPYLMGWTADFTVAALRLTGVPVYREGQQLVIPSGVWAVVEACSGLRYLIASLMVGTLFAYLMYRSLGRRLMFVALSIVVPIVANWLRAYMIVMIGHFSNNRLAVGVDHLIYGWLFFGVVIACLFWLGGRWREDHLPATVPPMRTPADALPERASRLWAAAAAVLVLTAGWKLAYFAVERSDASSLPNVAAVKVGNGWQQTMDAPAQWTPHFINPSAELRQAFGNGPRHVGMVLGYYRNQGPTSKLVSSENLLVRTDDPVWLNVRTAVRNIQINGRAVQIRTAELRGRGGQELLVWHWYWINGHLTGSDYSAKAYTAMSRLRGEGDDSGSIVIYTVKQGGETAEKTLDAFVRAAGPAIEQALQQTRNSR